MACTRKAERQNLRSFIFPGMNVTVNRFVPFLRTPCDGVTENQSASKFCRMRNGRAHFASAVNVTDAGAATTPDTRTSLITPVSRMNGRSRTGYFVAQSRGISPVEKTLSSRRSMRAM